jgi:hypothetical protein
VTPERLAELRKLVSRAILSGECDPMVAFELLQEVDRLNSGLAFLERMFSEHRAQVPRGDA